MRVEATIENSIKMAVRERKVLETSGCTAKRKALVDTLKVIPTEAWDQIIRFEPEWPLTERLVKEEDFGKTAVVLIMAALNAFQLKGKAEENYWRDVESIFGDFMLPDLPEMLLPVLEPFYKTERIPTAKIKRLRRFLESPLAKELWLVTCGECARDFQLIWERLARTMRQNRCAKTICFAMKCLGVTLLGGGETGFEFSGIPIPVDSRVTRFTCEMGICQSEDEGHIRDIWDQILESLKSQNSNVDMILLDSLIWQVTGLSLEAKHKYFENLGIKQVGVNLASLLDRSSPKQPV